MIFAKFNLEVTNPPPYVREVLTNPPPYMREVWHYKDASTKLIRRAIEEFNWQSAFLNTNVNIMKK